MKTEQVPEKERGKKPQPKQRIRPVAVLQFVLVAEKGLYEFLPSLFPPHSLWEIIYSPAFPFTFKAEVTRHVECQPLSP